MVDGDFVLLGTESDDSGILWALLAREREGDLSLRARRSSGRQRLVETGGYDCEGGSQSPRPSRHSPGFEQGLRHLHG